MLSRATKGSIVLKLNILKPSVNEAMDPARNGARRRLDVWQSRKEAASRQVDLSPKPALARRAESAS